MADIEALEQLKRVIQKTPNSEFDMRLWACGSVGCALGRAAMDPWFQAKGLVLSFRESFGTIVPTLGHGPWGIDAACVIFRLERREAQYLFLADSYQTSSVTRHHVLARIDKIISERPGVGRG